MKFLVDECTGTSVVACLRDEGHDAVAVVEVMPEADDEEILAHAVAEGRIVVTADKQHPTTRALVSWCTAVDGSIEVWYCCVCETNKRRTRCR